MQLQLTAAMDNAVAIDCSNMRGVAPGLQRVEAPRNAGNTRNRCDARHSFSSTIIVAVLFAFFSPPLPLYAGCPPPLICLVEIVIHSSVKGGARVQDPRA